MLKMTLLLAAALYGTLAIWGEPVRAVAVAPARASIDEAVAASLQDYARPVILDGAGTSAPQVTRAATTRTVVPEAAELAANGPGAIRPIGEPLVVSLLGPEPSDAAQAPAAGLMRVNGSRVNMRAGPSTSEGVVASLSQGTLAEPVGAAIDGWQQVRVSETGLTGFMAARFLDPA